MKYCCEKLKREIEQENGKSVLQRNVFVYDAKLRCFGASPNGTLEIYQPMDYCPFCGKKFSSNLVEKYWEILIDEVGAEYYPTHENYDANKPLPQEFQTDEWWKKRGL